MNLKRLAEEELDARGSTSYEGYTDDPKSVIELVNASTRDLLKAMSSSALIELTDHLTAEELLDRLVKETA